MPAASNYLPKGPRVSLLFVFIPNLERKTIVFDIDETLVLATGKPHQQQ